MMINIKFIIYMRRRFMLTQGFNESFDFNNYLTIEALEDGLVVSFTNDIEYGIDGQGWKTLNVGKTTKSINAGQTISFRGELTPSTYTGVGTFTISKSCNLKGNCMSLLFGDNAGDDYSLSDYDYAFYELFYNCADIKSVSADFLPATTLASYCYSRMFNGCSNLTTAPELPATTLASYCYSRMFRLCSKLNYIKMLATDISASWCLYDWVLEVASSGTFVKNAAMTSLPTGVRGIPEGWTVVNDGEENGGG